MSHSRARRRAGRILLGALLAFSFEGVGPDVARAQSAAAASAESLERWTRELRQLDAEGDNWLHLHQTGPALGAAQAAVQICEISPGLPAALYASSLLRLAGLLELVGRPTEAIVAYRRAVAKLVEDPHPSPAMLSGARKKLAELLYRQGWVEEARRQARPSFVTEAGSGDLRGRANQLGSLAAFQDENGDRDGAASSDREALALLSGNGGMDDLIASLSERLAMVSFNAGDYVQAEASYRRAVEIVERQRPSDATRSALALGGLASALLPQGKCSEATQRLTQALALLPPANPSTISTREVLALSLVCQGEVDAAERQIGLLDSGFSAPNSRSGPVYARFLDTAVAVTWAKGDVGLTLRALRLAIDARRDVTSSMLTGRTESQRRAYLSVVRRMVDTAVSFNLTDARGSPDATRTAFEALIDFKGRLLEASGDDRLKEQRVANGTLNELSRNQETLDQIAAIEHMRDPAVALTAAPPVSMQSIQAALHPSDALIELTEYRPVDPHQPPRALSEPHYAAYVLRRQGMPIAVELGRARTVDQLVEQARGLLVSKDAGYSNVAEQLYSAVFQPIVGVLGDGVNLYIAPDAELNLLPFAALVDGTHQYVAKKYLITYLTSGRDLTHFTHRLIPRSQPQIFAAPDYDAVLQRGGAGASAGDGSLLAVLGLGNFPALGGTAKEARALAPILRINEDRVHTGAQATEASLKSVQGPSILHIATHGFFVGGPDDSSPGTRAATAAIQSPSTVHAAARPSADLPPLVRSGLAFAGANRMGAPPEDGLLTAQEIMEVDLRGTQLVTLSACETARGTTTVGDGVWGLRRALAAAGAETQLITLWRLDDAATVAMMTAYYARLKNGEGRSAALRNAQLSILDQHPYYWASFIVAGDASPLHDTIIMPGL